MIIKHPVDFSTMQEKIKNNDHQSIEELTDNFKRMCANATIYYKAAEKLLRSGMKILSQERIQSLKQSIDFMADLWKTQKQKDRTDTLQGGEGGCWLRERETEREREREGERERETEREREREREESEDGQALLKPKREQEQLDHIVKKSGGKLIGWAMNSQYEVERRKSYGMMTLRLLHPVDLIVGEPGYCPGRLGMTTGRLQSGVNTLQGFKEDKRNNGTPILIFEVISASLNFWPHAKIIHMLWQLVSLLNVLTKGGYSRTLQELELSLPEDEGHTRTLDTAKEMEITEREPAGHLDSNTQDRLIAVKAVPYFGLPVDVFDSEEAEVFQKKLETIRLPRELQEAQNERLSTRPSPNMIRLLCPSSREMHLTEQVTNNLKEFAQEVTPGDIVSTYRVRKAMGSSIPSPVVENNFVDWIEDIQEPKKMGVAECGPIGS
ncbi:Bromodomain-containing protein 7 [Plecturocebus cupreus]